MFSSDSSVWVKCTEGIWQCKGAIQSLKEIKDYKKSYRLGITKLLLRSAIKPCYSNIPKARSCLQGFATVENMAVTRTLLMTLDKADPP